MAITKSTHAHYDARVRDWTLIQRMMTTEDVTAELVQRYFEHPGHFQQRKQDSRGCEPLTSYLISRLVGILFQKADDVSRDIGPVLSDADLERAGPSGEDYRVQLVQLAQTLLAYDEAIVTLNPARGVEVLPPHVRRNFGRYNGEPAVVLKSTRDAGGDITSDVSILETWTVYTPTRYHVFRKGEKDEADDVLVEEGLWAEPENGEAFYFVDETGAPVPPVLHFDTPWAVRLGLQIAKGHRDIYETTSRRDFHLAGAMNGLIQIGVGSDADLGEQIEKKVRNGAQMLPYASEYGEHKGLELPISGVQHGTEVIKEKRDALRRTAYDQLDEAAQQTATQSMIEHQGGAAAALSVLAETMADAETRILALWSQAMDRRLGGPNPQAIDVACTWPADYSKVMDDVDLARDIFRGPLPVDLDTATQVVMDKLAEAGQEADEDAIRGAVERAMSNTAQSQSMLG